MIEKKCAHSLVVDKVAKADVLISVDPVKVAKADAVKVVLVHGLKVVGTIGAPTHVPVVVKVIDVPAHGLKVVKTRADLAKAIEINRGPTAVVPKEY